MTVLHYVIYSNIDLQFFIFSMIGKTFYIMKGVIVYFINDQNQVLMAKKGRGVGKGNYFGYGGKMEDIDRGDPLACIKRELDTETKKGIIVRTSMLKLVGVVDFFKGEDKKPFESEPFTVLFYRSFQKINKIPESTDEMIDPRWFDMVNIPWRTENMKAGDESFIPLVLLGVPFKGYQWFSSDEKTVLEQSFRFIKPEEILPYFKKAS